MACWWLLAVANIAVLCWSFRFPDVYRPFAFHSHLPSPLSVKPFQVTDQILISCSLHLLSTGAYSTEWCLYVQYSPSLIIVSQMLFIVHVFVLTSLVTLILSSFGYFLFENKLSRTTSFTLDLFFIQHLPQISKLSLIHRQTSWKGETCSHLFVSHYSWSLLVNWKGLQYYPWILIAYFCGLPPFPALLNIFCPLMSLQCCMLSAC